MSALMLRFFLGSIILAVLDTFIRGGMVMLTMLILVGLFHLTLVRLDP